MARNIDIVCVDDPAEVVAEKLAVAARAGGNIVLTGGTSVAHAYERAAALEPDWSKVDVWFTDERCVPTDDDRSNYKLVHDTLQVSELTPFPYAGAQPFDPPAYDAWLGAVWRAGLRGAPFPAPPAGGATA